MPSSSAGKIKCLNPNTGRKMNIDEKVYNLFNKAIYNAVMKNKQGLTYTDIVRGIKLSFKEERTVFQGSIEWYAVTVKNDMVANGVIDTFAEKGRKLHKLKSTPLSK